MKKPKANSSASASNVLESQLVQLTAAEEKAYEEFGHWFDGELEQLVARWAHLAAPNASRRGLSRGRML